MFMGYSLFSKGIHFMDAFFIKNIFVFFVKEYKNIAKFVI